MVELVRVSEWKHLVSSSDKQCAAIYRCFFLLKLVLPGCVEDYLSYSYYIQVKMIGRRLAANATIQLQAFIIGKTSDALKPKTLWSVASATAGLQGFSSAWDATGGPSLQHAGWSWRPQKLFGKKFTQYARYRGNIKKASTMKRVYEKVVNLEISTTKKFNASRDTCLRFQKVFPTTQPSLNFKIARGWKAVFKDVQPTLQWACTAARTLESELCALH